MVNINNNLSEIFYVHGMCDYKLNLKVKSYAGPLLLINLLISINRLSFDWFKIKIVILNCIRYKYSDERVFFYCNEIYNSFLKCVKITYL